MTGLALAAPVPLRGFDVNETLTRGMARAFAIHGYQFAVRYVRRATARSSDLSAQEIADLHAVGLGVMAVQHVESEASWTPSAAKGTLYGQNAADACTEIGLAPGTTVWLDLEGVAPGTPHADIIGYCCAWYLLVAKAGFLPGLYVGWHAGLTPAELYRLPFARYWGAYNLNADERPVVRGVCMQQHEAEDGDVPPGLGCAIDVDTIAQDAEGDVPVLCVPDGWAP